ncbi:MAG TPA: nucleoside 2-deoxyribosyltransferase [Methylomirabilota bacterium]|jgi:nucleoside 2-deoxyribosyltransferase|nr:nucleoside 2-deoxyribosyltransferase [Methylomirabilota bacterium]
MGRLTVARVRLYLAGPLGFSEAGRAFYHGRLLPLVEGLGYDVIDPWALTDPQRLEAVRSIPDGPERRAAWRRLNHEIGETNRRAIEQADGVLAVLDGPDVDSGTAAEIGFAFAQSKPIVGYRGDVRITADNEGALVNLQVEYFILAGGGAIVTGLDELESALRSIFG